MFLRKGTKAIPGITYGKLMGLPDNGSTADIGRICKVLPLCYSPCTCRPAKKTHTVEKMVDAVDANFRWKLKVWAKVTRGPGH